MSEHPEPWLPPQPPLQPPAPAWFEKPRETLAPDEIDGLDRRLGRGKRKPRFFL